METLDILKTQERIYRVSNIKENLGKITSLVDKVDFPNDGLFSGNMGKALYFLYLYKYSSNPVHHAAGMEIMEGIIRQISDGTSPLLKKTSLGSGLVGFSWALKILSDENLINFDVEEFTDELNKRLISLFPFQIQENNFDFIHSSIGALAYLVDQLEGKPELEEPILDILRQVSSKVEHHSKGGAYLKNQYFFKKTNIGFEDEVNLRLPHGYNSLLLILVNLFEKNIGRPIVKEMLENGIAFIISTLNFDNLQTPRKSISPSNVIVSLPSDHPQNVIFYQQRLAWCYGDLCHVLLLYKAGKLLDKPDWIAIADKMGAFNLEKTSFEDTLIDDVYLCHGSAGVARFYNALYEASGIEAYKEGYQYWITQTVDKLNELLVSPEESKPGCTFLDGLMGTGLTLISDIEGKKSSWEKFLLLY